MTMYAWVVMEGHPSVRQCLPSLTLCPLPSQEHQLAVIDCLEDPDDTLKLKTLELLYKMTKANNAEVIVERMMTYLRR